MKIKNYIYLAIALSSNFFTLAQSVKDKSFQITPYVGFSSPSGNFKDFASNGFVAGLSMDKYLNSHFALGLDFNYQSNPFQSAYDFSGITNPFSISETQNGNWSTSTLTFGPTYKIGSKKFTAEAYSKAGISYTKSPSYDVTLSSGALSKSILTLPEQERSSFGLTSGIRFNYSITDKLSLFLNPQYVYSSSKVEYCNCGLDNLNNPDLIVEQQPIKETFSPSFINFNAGVKWRLGGSESNASKANNDNQNIKCEETFLKTPYNNEYLNLDSEKSPVFSWSNQNPQQIKNYILRISVDNKLIYEKETKNNSFTSDKKLINLLKSSSDNKKYSWNITTNFKNCEPLVTKSIAFSTSSRVGTIHDITLSCDSPAYTETGNIKIKGELVFFSSTYSNILVVNSNNDISINDSSDNPISGAIISNVRYCANGNPVTFPISIPASNTQSPTICFDLELPSGTTNIISRINGIVDGTKQSSGDPDAIPTCICNLCKDWEYNDSEHKLVKYNAAGPFNFQLTQSLEVFGTNPIIEIKAEIISVQHVANDPQCYTCTKHESKMGMFSFDPGFLQPRISGTNVQNEWNNSAIGIKGQNTNNDYYANQVVWRAKDPTVGVDITKLHRFMMPISLPDQSRLSCCEHEYKVCVRYTFTDINCASCSYEQCYSSKSTASPNDLQNPTSSTGSSIPKIPNEKLQKN